MTGCGPIDLADEFKRETGSTVREATHSWVRTPSGLRRCRAGDRAGVRLGIPPDGSLYVLSGWGGPMIVIVPPAVYLAGPPQHPQCRARAFRSSTGPA